MKTSFLERLFQRRLCIVMLMCTPLLAATALQKNTVTIKGSDTMVILVQRWTEMYPNARRVKFQVTGGGSGTGISSLINGTTDICASSRRIKPNEVRQLKYRFNTPGVEVAVAKDGITVYLNASNPIQRLTLYQLRKIYRGEITNWKQLGGRDAAIILYCRQNNSGTYQFFKDVVLHEDDFAPQAQSLVGTAALVNAVKKDKNGIGFGGAAYASGVKKIALGRTAAGPFYYPNKENVRNGSYPLSRYLYFYLRGKPHGDVRKFIDWIRSENGQSIVTQVGYFPLK